MPVLDKPKRLWRRLFRKNDYYAEIVEQAVEAQVRFETAQGVPYSRVQRQTALMQRAFRLHGGDLPLPLIALITEAAADWERASKAALEEP